MRRTVAEKALEGSLDVEFRVEDDEPEANRKDIIASAASEEDTDSVDGLTVVALWR